MSPNISLEDRLESLGAALRSRPRQTAELMDKVREAALTGSTERPVSLRLHDLLRRRRKLITAATGTMAAICAVLLIAIVWSPSQAVGWAEVAKAIQSQKWIHGTITFADGEPGAMWMSPERQIWAFRLNESFYFNDGRERAKYEYLGRNKPITKYPLGEDDAQKVLPLNALSQDKSTIGPWLFGTEKILEQQRREVVEGGKTWIEFQMVLWRREMNQATLRVDPKTRLPVYMIIASPKDQTNSIRWVFDYPAEGPTDIYALGVPREIKIDDRMPADNVLRVLDAMAASRASIGNFRLIVGQSNFFPSSVVYRKGNRWRVDSWRSKRGEQLDLMPDAPEERNWGEWFAEQIRLSYLSQVFVCDGKTVWQNSSFQPGAEPRWKPSREAAPLDLMSGEGLGMLSMAPGAKIASLLFPDLSPKPGWGFEFDAKPADAPGCVLIKRSTGVTFPKGAIGHEWYYLDQEKGYALVRAELFSLPPEAKAVPDATRGQNLRMVDFRQSSQGFWYPAIVHNTMHFLARDNQQGQGATQQIKTVARYYFDFNADLPDSLFTIDEAQVLK